MTKTNKHSYSWCFTWNYSPESYKSARKKRSLLPLLCTYSRRKRAHGIDDQLNDQINQIIKGALIAGIGFGEEFAPKRGKTHLQGWIVFKYPVRFGIFKTLMPGAHIENMKGLVEQCRGYCSKDGIYDEYILEEMPKLHWWASLDWPRNAKLKEASIKKIKTDQA